MFHFFALLDAAIVPWSAGSDVGAILTGIIFIVLLAVVAASAVIAAILVIQAVRKRKKEEQGKQC